VKKAAKQLASQLSVPLSSAQRAIARGCGYQDWHDVEGEVADVPPCPLDQSLSADAFVERQRILILKIAADLGASEGDVQYALSDARVTGDRTPQLEEQIAICIACWRAKDIPYTGARQNGAVGVLKTKGRNGEPVILRSFGSPTEVLTHRGVMSIADFEYVSPRRTAYLFVPMRLFLPYGYWTEADGARVLFSRDYHPLWRLRDNQAPERVEPWTRIKFKDQTWLWDDANTPWETPKVEAALIGFLKMHGLHQLPILTDALPLLVRETGRLAPRVADSAALLQAQRTTAAHIAVANGQEPRQSLH